MCPKSKKQRPCQSQQVKQRPLQVHSKTNPLHSLNRKVDSYFSFVKHNNTHSLSLISKCEYVFFFWSESKENRVSVASESKAETKPPLKHNTQREVSPIERPLQPSTKEATPSPSKEAQPERESRKPLNALEAEKYIHFQFLWFSHISYNELQKCFLSKNERSPRIWKGQYFLQFVVIFKRK